MNLSLPSVSALPSLCMAQISPRLAHSSLLNHRRRHFTFFSYNLSMSFFDCPPPCSVAADGCLAVKSINQHETERKRRRKDRRKTATGESLSTSCRWSCGAVQLLLVLLLLLLRKREWQRRRITEGERGREKIGACSGKCFAERIK